MRLSIIIVNYNTRGLLRNCLHNLLRVLTLEDEEIIVIDNASHDGSVAMVRKLFPNTILICAPRNLGHIGGNNLGMLYAKGEYVCFVNSDTLFSSNPFPTLMAFMQEHPRAAAVAPRLENPDGSTQVSCFAFPDFWTPFYRRTAIGDTVWGKRAQERYRLDRLDRTRASMVDWVTSSVMLVRRTSWQDVGPMDKRFFVYFGDVDWCRRAWQQGKEIWYVPDASVIHYYHRESVGLSLINHLASPAARYHIKDWMMYILKYIPDIRYVH